MKRKHFITACPTVFRRAGPVHNGVFTAEACECAPAFAVERKVFHVGKSIGEKIKISPQRAVGMCIVLGGLLFSPSMQAMEAQIASMAPKATCDIMNTSSVKFGNYNPLSSSPVTSTGTIRVRCTGSGTGPFPVTITLSGGSSGNPTQRYMPAGTTKLQYNLYCDANRTIIWGDGITQPGCKLTVPSKQPISFTVYGKISSTGQNVNAGGPYTDNLTVDPGTDDL
jgi:spore coat protein U-like protein